MSTSSTSVIDRYIARFPVETQTILHRLRDLIRQLAPDASEALKYGIPTFVLGENLVHFAAFKKHIGFYPTPSAIERFAAELRGYPNSKGAIQFPLTRPLPFDLVEKIVKFRVTEARQRAAAAASPAKPSRRDQTQRKPTSAKSATPSSAQQTNRSRKALNKPRPATRRDGKSRPQK